MQHLDTSAVPTVKYTLGLEITTWLKKTLRLGLVASIRPTLGAPEGISWRRKLSFHPALVDAAPRH